MMGVIPFDLLQTSPVFIEYNTNKNKFRKPIETPVLHKYFL